MGLLALVPGILCVVVGIAFANGAQVQGFFIHGLIFAAAGIAGIGWVMKRDFKAPGLVDAAGNELAYNDEIVRAGVIASTFWGVVGFLVGLVIALQLADTVDKPLLIGF